jgi:hypothetical protein
MDDYLASSIEKGKGYKVTFLKLIEYGYPSLLEHMFYDIINKNKNTGVCT